MATAPVSTAADLTLHVSPLGRASWSGTCAAPTADGSDGPLPGPTAARDALRRLRALPEFAARPVSVVLQAGVYELDETLSFGPADGGSAAAPVRYVAAAGAAPVISGGRQLNLWQETTHGSLRAWVTDLPEVAAGTWNFTRLYVNQTARPRPRLPRTGYHHFTGVAGYPDSGFAWCKGPDKANYAPGDLQAWRNLADVEVISYQLWFDTHHRIKALEEATQTVYFHTRSLGSLRDERGEFARYFVENVYEALDTPGQWYLDRPTGRLTYLPLPGETLATTSVVAPRLTELLRLQAADGQGVAHLQFENLTFAHQHWELPLSCPGYIQAAFGVPGAVLLEGARDCVFYGCTFAHLNGYGVEILAGSSGNTLAACSLYDAGAGGVKVDHEAMRQSDHPTAIGARGEAQVVPPSATTVVDCTIRDCGHIYPSAIGIWVGNSGWNRLLYNRIFNCTYTGISCGWTWGYTPTRTVRNLIIGNHIHHINHREVLSDNGGIYTLGQQPGTVLRGNVIHDISCYGYGAWGIYPDEGSSEMLVEQNLVCGTKKGAYSTHYGRDNLVRDNIFALSQGQHLGLGKRELHRSTVFRRNLCVCANGQVEGGVAASYYTVADNLFWSLNGTPFTFAGVPLAQATAQGDIRGAVVADPLFTDAAGGDFSLRPDSPAYALGFKAFDWRAVGPRLKATRPGDYATFAVKYPLPVAAVPVIRTLIELVTPAATVAAIGVAEFAVTLTNVGQAAGQGAIRLSAGPAKAARAPSLRQLSFDLAPGAAASHTVTVKVARSAAHYWLESEPVGDVTVPARKLVLASAGHQWLAPRVAAPATPAGIAGALHTVLPREFALAGRTVANIKLGATDAGLLLTAHYLETRLRPDTERPWQGTALEVLAMLPIVADAPTGTPRPRHQVFLVPQADGAAMAGARMDFAANRVVPAPEILTSAALVPDGLALNALIPWPLLGHQRAPAEFEFELLVDVLDAAGDKVMQIPAFNLPADGWQPRYGRVVITG